MRRLLTVGGVLLVAALAFGLYRLKYEVQRLEDRHAVINRAILAEQEAIRVLKAEWSFLNNPARLAALVERHLALQPVVAERVITLSELPADPVSAAARAEQRAGRVPVRLPIAKDR